VSAGEESGVDHLRRRAEQAIASEQGRRVIIPLLERLVSLAPDGSPASLFAHRHLAEYRVEEHPWRALLSLRKVIVATPDDDVVHALMGLAQALLSNFRAAIEAYKRALAISPRNPWYHHNLGHLLDVALDRPDQALKHLELAHKATAPNDHEIAASLAHCLARLGKLAEARTLAATAAAASPKNADHKKLLDWIERGAPEEPKTASTGTKPGAVASASQLAGSATTTSNGSVSAPSSGSSSMSSGGSQSQSSGGQLAGMAPTHQLTSLSSGGGGQAAAQASATAPAPAQPTSAIATTSIPSARAAKGPESDAAMDAGDPVLPIIKDTMREGGFTREHVARARRLWVDYRSARGSWELLKPDVCAAALEYAIARLHGLDGVTRASVARRYGVSASAIADRFDDMQVVLTLRPADERYFS
jgi:tetratricopeptide (TPR) repeat protein